MHADHITGTGYLRVLSGCKTVISKASGADADIHVEGNDEIAFGSQKLKVLSTPGHTNGCVTYYNSQQVTWQPNCAKIKTPVYFHLISGRCFYRGRPSHPRVRKNRFSRRKSSHALQKRPREDFQASKCNASFSSP